MTNPVEAARAYLAAGWAVVPVEPSTKSPKIKDWPTHAAERAWPAEDFEGYNVGVVLGSVSRDLVDIDLDSSLALQLAPAFLPDTLTFGRESKPRSHWLYYAAGVRSAMYWFRVGDDPKERDLIEIRSTNASSDTCGHQSVFPGSTHESGQAVEWTEGDTHEEPQPVDPGALVWAVCRLTVACIVLRDWQEGSGRRTKALCISAGLLSQGWTADEVRELFEAVQEAAGDTDAERRDFGHQVETTIEAIDAGREVQGYGSLVAEGIFEAAQLKELERHARTPETRLREVKMATTGAGAGMRRAMLADARAVDGLTSAADLVAAFGKEESDDSTRRREVDAGPAGSVPEDPGSTLHAFESRGALADLSREPEPLSYLWGPLAPGKVSAIASFANGGKSPYLQLLLLHCVEGQPLFGMSTRKCDALLCDFESGRLAEIRMRRIANGMGLAAVPSGLKLMHMNDAIDEDWIVDLDSYLSVNRSIGVVGIDTYGAAMAADLDHNSAQFAHWLKQLGHLSHALDVVIVVLLHEKKREQGKRKGSDLEMISGHNAAPGALQGVVSLYRPDDNDKTLISVQCARAPEDAFETFNIRWEDCGDPAATTPGAKLASKGLKWGLRATLAEKTTAEKQAEETHAGLQLRVFEILGVQRPDGDTMPKAELLGHLRGKKETAINAIDALVATGKIGGSYKPGVTRNGAKQSVWLLGRKNSPIG